MKNIEDVQLDALQVPTTGLDWYSCDVHYAPDDKVDHNVLTDGPDRSADPATSGL